MGHTLLQFPRARYRSIIEALALAETYGELEDACDYTMSLEIADVEDAYARRKDEPEWLRWDDPWSFYAPAAIAARQLRWRKEPPDRGGETPPDGAANDRKPGSRGRQHKKRSLRTH